MVTILLPTVDRPQMLRTALRSIADQTAVDRVERVIVSENSGGRHAEAVCQEFKDCFPIEYRTQPLPLAPLEHFVGLKGPDNGFVAILHDDDWWAPNHLAASLHRLERHPDAAATYSGIFLVESESSQLSCDSNLMFWFGGRFPRISEEWLLPPSDVLFSCLWGTPGHHSALLARAAAYKQASLVHELKNPWDVDRMLTFELVRSGSLIFNPLPEVFIRHHPSQASRSFDSTDRNNYFRITTERLLAQADETQTPIKSGLESRLQVCPDSARTIVLHALSSPWCVEPLIARRYAPSALETYASTIRPKPANFRYHLGRLLPPGLLETLGRRPRWPRT